MRRVSSYSFADAVSSSSGALFKQHRCLWFTAQAEELARSKEERGYKSDLWVAEDDCKAMKLKVKKDDRFLSTQATLPHSREYHNTQELWQFSTDEIGEPENHSNVASRQPYRGQLLEELEERSQARNYTSKWWVTPSVIKRDKLKLRRGALPCVLRLDYKANVWNVDQLENPELVTGEIFSAGTAKRLWNPELKQEVQAKGYSTGVFFTKGQLEQFGLSKKAEGGAGFTHSIVEKEFALYNLTQCQNWEQFIEERELAQPDPKVPTYLNGVAIRGNNVLNRIKELGEMKNNLWVMHSELAPNELRLEPGSTSVDSRNFAEVKQASITWTNLDDVSDKESAMKQLGTFIR